MPFDPTNKADKAQLYQVLKAIAKLGYGDTVDLLIDRAVGQPVPHGDNWQRNYRRGEYDSVIAQITHRWVETNHFTLAHEVAPDIFPNTPARQWRRVLDERADETKLRLMIVKPAFGIAKRKSQLGEVDQIIKWGQFFCLELDSEVEGYAVALQSQGEEWGVIPLGPNGKGTAGPIQQGVNYLPQDSEGNLDPLEEDSDEGLTDFVVITAKTDRIMQPRMTEVRGFCYDETGSIWGQWSGFAFTARWGW